MVKVFLQCVVAVVVCGAVTVQAADGIGRVVKNTPASGEPGVAVILKASGLKKEAVARQHVILIDTSASQVGEHRRQSLSLLESLLKSLPDGDRVRLFAADLQAEPLDEDFNEVHSPAVASAVATLKLRVPLGATNLEGILRSALAAAGDKPTDVTYIGDGLSTADLVELPELRALVADFRRQRVPVHSFGIGPQRNLQLLGILALQTGGIVTFDAEIDSSDEVLVGDDPKATRIASDIARLQGKALATALKAPIFFPTKLQVEPEGVALLPADALPIRGDREAIYLVNGLPGNASIVMSDEAGETIRWILPAAVEQPTSTFLPVMVRQVEETRGMTNPLGGMVLFRLSQKDFSLNVTTMAQRGHQAVKIGDLQQAIKIYEMLVPLEPNNEVVKDLRKAIDVLKASETKKPDTTKPSTSKPKK